MADDKTFKMLIEEQRRTTAVVEKSMMSAEERAVVEAAERNKFEKRSEASTRGAETKRINILTRKNNTQTASQEESSNDSNSYLRDTFKSFLGKGSLIAGKLGNIGDGLKSKVKGGLEGIFKAIKTGAFVALLLGLTKFLQSETFKDIKDKYLPSIVDGLNSLGKTLMGIIDDFFVLKDGKYTFSAAAGFNGIFTKIKLAFIAFKDDLLSSFLDENGDLTIKSFLTGIPTAFGKIAIALGAVSGLLFLLSPRIFFGTAWLLGKGGFKLFGKLLGVGGKLALGFGKLFLSMTGMGTSLTATGTAMSSKLDTSKKTGVFRRGLGGIAGRFGRLFRFFGKRRGLAGLIIGAGVGMSALLTSNSGPDGIFSKIGTSFGTLFTKVGAFGAKIGTTVSGMATKLATSLSDGVFSVANGIGTGFTKLFGKVSSFGSSVATTVKGMGTSLTNSTAFKTITSGFSSLFGVLSDFSAKIASVAAKATAKVASVVAKSLANVAEIGAKVAKPAVKLSKTALSALRGTGEFAFKKLKVDPSILKAMKSTPKIPTNIIPESKIKSKPKLSAAQRAAFSGTGEFATNPKLVTKLTEAALKKSIAKRTAMLAVKALPIAGIVAGTIFTGMRLLKGDFLGASMEAGGIFLPSLAGLPVDAAIMARDVYKDNYGVFPEKETNKALRYQRMKQIVAAVKASMPGGAEIETNAPNIGDLPVATGSSSNAGTGNIYRGPDDGMRGGTLVNAPVTNIVTSNNNKSEKSYFSKALTMQDPIISSAIGAM